VGKSRLALRLATALSAQFRDGVHAIDATTHEQSRALEHTVAQLLESRRVITAASGKRLTERLAARELLLMIDNCDPIIGECAELAARLLKACPGVHILATSRGPLHIDGEVVWRVPPLSLPSPDANAAAELLQSAAVRLFVARVRARMPGFALNSETARAVARICRCVDGLPLALEIAAEHVTSTGLTSLAMRLDSAYALRLQSSSDAPQRHRSLRAALDWSYALLSDSERVLFARLATFVGGWTLEAAEMVCADLQLARTRVADLIDSLVSGSLIVLGEDDSPARFGFARLVHQYAFDLLEASGEAELIQRRHAEYITALAWRVHPARLDSDHVTELASDGGNFRAALRWALRINEAGLAFRLAIAGHGFWYLLGRFSEGDAWMKRCLAVPSTAAERNYRAAVQCAAGHMALLVGDVRRARRLLDEALSTQRALDEPGGISLALHVLALVALVAGNLEQAREYCQESQRSIKRVRADRPLANFLRSAILLTGGRVACELGDQRRARDLAAQAASLAQTTDSRVLHARAVQLHAVIATRAGQHLVALDLIERAIESQRALGDGEGLLDSLCTLGQIRLEFGSSSDCLNAFVEAVALARENGQPLGVMRALEGVAHVLSSTDHGDAVRLAGFCEARRVQLGSVPWPDQRRSTSAWQVRVRSEMGAAAFNTARSAGRGWTVTDALRLLAARSAASTVTADRPNPLTPRERGVTRLLVQDLSNEQVSMALGISVGTVRSHVDHILAKLGLHSRAQLAVWALQDEGRRSLGSPDANFSSR
jgi:predicted ATPase/DNA-binding CsgD family transcriptional regulator